ncbi:hypothetical protein RJZ56_006618 [Blastomyces dermatitidis]
MEMEMEMEMEEIEKIEEIEEIIEEEEEGRKEVRLVIAARETTVRPGKEQQEQQGEGS